MLPVSTRLQVDDQRSPKIHRTQHLPNFPNQTVPAPLSHTNLHILCRCFELKYLVDYSVKYPLVVNRSQGLSPYTFSNENPFSNSLPHPYRSPLRTVGKVYRSEWQLTRYGPGNQRRVKRPLSKETRQPFPRYSFDVGKGNKRSNLNGKLHPEGNRNFHRPGVRRFRTSSPQSFRHPLPSNVIHSGTRHREPRNIAVLRYCFRILRLFIDWNSLPTPFTLR